MASTVWRGRLAFGMVAIPVRMYKAARRERIRFRQVARPQHLHAVPPPEEPEEVEESGPGPEPVPEVAPVRQVLSFDHYAPQPLPKSEVLKGFEIEKDQYVVFEPHEVAALRPKTSTEVAIAEFVHLEEIDPVFFDVSYYLVPEAGAEKAYAILFRALQQSGYAAIGSLSMHGREHATVIRPGKYGLLLHTLFYSNEVRADEEYRVDVSSVQEKELDLATRFVEALAAPFEPAKLKDEFEQRLKELIDSRAGEALSSSTAASGRKPPAPVIDIMDALKKSIEAAKLRKPPQKAEAPKKAAPRKRAR